MGNSSLHSQNFKESSQRKKMWGKWSRKEKKNKRPFNPYLDKDTGKPKKEMSRAQTKENEKVVKQQKKEIRREKRRLRRTRGAYKN